VGSSQALKKASLNQCHLPDQVDQKGNVPIIQDKGFIEWIGAGQEVSHAGLQDVTGNSIFDYGADVLVCEGPWDRCWRF